MKEESILFITLYILTIILTICSLNLFSSEIQCVTYLQQFKKQYSLNYFNQTRFIILVINGLLYICMKYSLWNNHLYAMPSSTQRCQCGLTHQDNLHFLIECPLYLTQTAILHWKVIAHTPFTLYTLLYGVKVMNNIVKHEIFLSVHEYIENTGRFVRNWILVNSTGVSRKDSTYVWLFMVCMLSSIVIEVYFPLSRCIPCVSSHYFISIMFR